MSTLIKGYLFGFFLFEIESMSKMSLDPCKMPNEKINIKPSMISKSPDNIEVNQSPTKLSSIDIL